MADFVGATRVVARRSALQRLITNSFCGTTMTHGGHNKARHPDGCGPFSGRDHAGRPYNP